MGEILGIGVTHYPPLLSKPQTYANLMRIVLTSPMVPPEMRQPANWPEPMQEEYAHEAARAVQHQERMVEAFRQVRRAIDDFGPDAVIIFGDDQYENFKEDCIPPFCVFLHDRMESRPFAHGLLGFGGENNVWGEPADATFVHRGDKPLAKHIATELMEQDFPISYAFTNSHHAEQHGPTELTHAFLNGLLYLDWDRKGFDYPVVPIQVNAYGKDVVPNRGVIAHLDPKTKSEPFGDELGPPAPSAASCARLGGLLRDILEARAGKYVIMASSGWSHAFLTEKHHWLYPDIAADREHLEELRLGHHPRWAHLTHAQIDAAGEHEFRNWICLAGAMPGYRADIVDYLETYIFNSNKCFAILRDDNGAHW
ncbi:MAG TPA: extradiol ring-cleavage dioxygenase [Candidatus Entotheonella sp.]